MKRELLYINEGRGGQVLYRDSVSEIRFDFEFGGGNCVAIVFIPTEEKWSQETNRKIEDRDGIIKFVAERATEDQTSNGRFEIFDNLIEIYGSR